MTWLQPGRIVPSVNADGPAGPKTRHMLQLLMGPETTLTGPGSSGGGGGRNVDGRAPPVRRDIRSFLRSPTSGAEPGAGDDDVAE